MMTVNGSLGPWKVISVSGNLDAATTPAIRRLFADRMDGGSTRLLVDLSSASGSGSIALQPVAGSGWPVRLALRVTRAAIGRLEVHGDQSEILPITPGTGTVDLELAPGLYSAHTQQLTIAWGPEPAAPALPAPDATPPR